MSLYRDILKEYKDIGSTENPQFEKSRKCHDWRNYVPDKIRDIWGALSDETRIMVFLTAEKQSNLEDWDDK